LIVVLLGVALGAQGCAGIGLTLLSVAAGTAAGTGTSHALDGITYKTFTVPLDGVERAATMTLKRMDLALEEKADTDEGRRLVAKSESRTIEIELERVSSRATRMRVVAKQNWLLRDRATAAEVIAQTDQTLTDHPYLASTAPAPLAKRAARN
jgi:hypothetical protein